jgi:hypothetical protein
MRDARLCGLIIVCVVGLGLTSAWSGAPPETFTLPPGPFVSPSRPIAAITGGNEVRLCLSFVGFDDAVTQALDYLWEVSADNGVTWEPWFGARITGGPHTDRQGNLITQFCGKSPPRLPGAGRLRMTGELTSPGSIEVTFTIEEVTP